MSLIIYLLDLQCAMCRAVLESGADQKAAESLNDGIVYLMINLNNRKKDLRKFISIIEESLIDFLKEY